MGLATHQRLCSIVRRERECIGEESNLLETNQEVCHRKMRKFMFSKRMSKNTYQIHDGHNEGPEKGREDTIGQISHH